MLLYDDVQSFVFTVARMIMDMCSRINGIWLDVYANYEELFNGDVKV